MITSEQLLEINRRLEDKYGKMDNLSYFRVIWSEDQLEKRWTEYTDEGWKLLYPEVRELPKYKQWVQNKYILEGLTAVPSITENDLVSPISYEPIWVFEDKHGNYLDPKWSAIYWILESLKSNQESQGKVKYKDPESNPEEALEIQKQRIKKIEEELFGNETSVGDGLAYNGAIVVP